MDTRWPPRHVLHVAPFRPVRFRALNLPLGNLPLGALVFHGQFFASAIRNSREIVFTLQEDTGQSQKGSSCRMLSGRDDWE